ncbi:MAG: NAD-dependent epimerase/dehydratase family protein [Salinibacterium sp.]|nr:NAD-dependent epimerase/dehydratase family protein [Salinibacterium sp.]
MPGPRLGTMAQRMLFIGGNGTISSAVSALAVERGVDLTLLNRGTSTSRPPLEGTRHLVGDASDSDSVRSAVGKLEFDVVVNFRSFLPSQVEADVDIFTGKAGQYVYISSASAYQKPVARLPITESTPLRNPFWEYSRNKIASEDILVAAYRQHGFPMTIVRPSHTYDMRSMPFDGGWTIIDRMRRGKPIVVAGDGTSLWVLTHHQDFARAFIELLGNQQTIGDAFHITSDEVLTWNDIARTLARAAGVEADIVHVASETIAEAIPPWGPYLIGDKANSVIFDNSKIKAIAPGWRATTPFWRGAQQIIEWHDEDPARRAVDPALDATLDGLARR